MENFIQTPYQGPSHHVDTTPVTPKKSKVWLWILVIIGIFLLAGSAGAYYLYQARAEIFAKTLDNISQIKTLSFSGEVNAKFTAQEKSLADQTADSLLPMGMSGSVMPQESGTAVLTLSGKIDNTDEENSNSEILLSLQSVTETETKKIAAEVKSKDKML